MLRTALGPAIARYLEDASIIEVMLIPQGSRLIGQYDSQVAFGQSRVLLFIATARSALAAFDLLAGIIATLPTGLGGFDALAIDDGGGC